MSIHAAAEQIYYRMWAESAERFAAGEVQIDRHLLRRAIDRRRGITLIARPGPETAARVAGLAAELRDLEPEQYFYRPDELHVTVMTLVSASEVFDLERVPIATYQSLFRELFGQARRFQIRFSGITASPGAVLIRGYVDDDYLNRLREAIRMALGRAGLADSLDARYRIVTAHSTIMRFRARPRDVTKFAARLHAARDRDFGGTTVERIDFVANDWYMSHDRVRVLAAYPLRPA